jgi:hypothetical protein
MRKNIIALFLSSFLLVSVTYAIDGFDYSAGKPNGDGYNNTAGWGWLEDTGSVYHPGEDFNGNGGGDTDLGDDVFAIADGEVVATGDYGAGWGNIVLIKHTLDNSSHTWSQYAHLQTITATTSSPGNMVLRGDKIGTIGKGHNNEYAAHLHLEIRYDNLAPDAWVTGMTESQIEADYYEPSLFINNDRPAINVSGNITTNTAWLTGRTYLVDGNLTVNSGVTLTINSGTVVKFKTATSMLTVSGTLDVNGSSGNKVYFTSYKDDTVGGDTNENGSSNSPAVGNWEVININSGGVADFDYAVIRYGGAANSWQDSFPNIRNSGSLTINHSEVSHSLDVGIQGYSAVNNIYNSTIHSNNFAGIRLDNSSDADIDGNHIGGNTTAGIYDATNANFSVTDNEFGYSNEGAILIIPEEGGNFTPNGNTSYGTNGGYAYSGGSLADSSTTWSDHDLPYIISGTLNVPSGKTLTINPGTIVKFGAASSSITVSGVLDVVSNGTDNVHFTSYKDDSVGGDTNGDGSTTTPAAENWSGISVSSVGNASIDNAILRYGGYGMIRVNGGTLDVSDSEIANGVEGLRVSSPSTITLVSNSFHDNSTYGAHNLTTMTVNAQGNYWGHSSGPYHASNSGGTGDSVTDYVNFSSWLTSWP